MPATIFLVKDDGAGLVFKAEFALDLFDGGFEGIG